MRTTDPHLGPLKCSTAAIIMSTWSQRAGDYPQHQVLEDEEEKEDPSAGKM